MSDSLTPNLKLTIQTIGGNNNTWGQKANDNFDRIDDKLGDTLDLSTTGGTTTLTETQEEVANIAVSGALLSNATIEFSGRGGFWIVKNSTTGSFSVTCKVTGETGVTVGQGKTALIWCNGTDIVSSIENVDSSAFATTTGNAWAAEITIADSATPAIGAAAGYRVRLDGTTTVTGFDSVSAGIWRIVRWNGTRSLTHGASLILLGAQSRSVAAGAFSMFRSQGSGVWREEFASASDGKPIIATAVADYTAETDIATGDYLPIADVSASSANRKMLVTDFLKIINALTEDTDPNPAADYALTYDASALAVKKVLLKNLKPIFVLGGACSDETSAIATGTGKLTFHIPVAVTVVGVFAELNTAQSSGNVVTVNIKEGGTTILSTKITIDNGEEIGGSSGYGTSSTPAVVSDASLAAGAKMTVDIDQIGDGTAKGLKVWLICHPT